MSKRKLTVVAMLLGVVALTIIWWLASPLFIQEVVDEPFPSAIEPETEIEVAAEQSDPPPPTNIPPTTMPTIAPTASMEIATEIAEGQPSEQSEPTIEPTIMPTDLPIATATATDIPATIAPTATADWMVTQQGEFRDFDNSHRGSGTASIFQQGTQRILRFEAFEVTNGPALHVLLVENIDAADHDGLGNYVDLGSLKGNVGNQNYEIPADIDLAQFEGVMIYCQPFQVVFSTAPFQ